MRGGMSRSGSQSAHTHAPAQFHGVQEDQRCESSYGHQQAASKGPFPQQPVWV